MAALAPFILFLIALFVERRMIDNEKKKENEGRPAGVTDPNKVKAE